MTTHPAPSPFEFDPSRVEVVDQGPAPEEGQRNFGFAYRSAWGLLDLKCSTRCSMESYARAAAREYADVIERDFHRALAGLSAHQRMAWMAAAQKGARDA